MAVVVGAVVLAVVLSAEGGEVVDVG